MVFRYAVCLAALFVGLHTVAPVVQASSDPDDVYQIVLKHWDCPAETIDDYKNAMKEGRWDKAFQYLLENCTLKEQPKDSESF